MKRLNERAGARKPNQLFHQAIIDAHKLGVVIILEHELPRTHFRFLVEKHFGAKVPLKLIQC